MGCALRECLCLSGKGSAFRTGRAFKHGEWLQEVEALCCEHWGLEPPCCKHWVKRFGSASNAAWSLSAATTSAWRLVAASSGAWGLCAASTWAWSFGAVSTGAWRLGAASTGAWRPGAASTEPGGAAWDSVPPSLSFPGSFCAETSVPAGCSEFCVSLSLSFPCNTFWHWECQLQALAVKTSGTGSDFCSHWE